MGQYSGSGSKFNVFFGSTPLVIKKVLFIILLCGVKVISFLSVKVCIVPDYSKPSLVKAFHEAMRSFDILMKFYPEKIVAGGSRAFLVCENRSGQYSAMG